MAEGGRTGGTPTAAHVPPAENSPTADPGVGHGSSNAPGNSQPAKKTKGKKNADSNDTGKLLAAKINQLEIDAAGEKDQEAEIEREVKKANRDLTNLLSGVKSDSSKLEVVQKKFSELVADMKRVDRDLIKSKKKADQLQKEKDSSRSELTKSTSLKDKLEKLSRELSKENKKLKEDYRTIEERENGRRDIFGDEVETILNHMEDIIDEKENPVGDKYIMETDELFRHKFKSFVEQYDLREHQFMTYCRNKELETQWHAARYELQRQAAESEKMRANNLSNQVTTFSQTEAELRGQLNIYVEKFKQVEDTLNNSNDLFMTFRKEMEEMSKKTKRLEKENLALSRKHDQTSHNIIQMTEERIRSNKDLEDLRARYKKLESISRAMQEQGRKVPEGMPGPDEIDEEGTESEYEDEEEYVDEDEEGESFEEEGNVLEGEMGLQGQRAGPRPPPMSATPQHQQQPPPNGSHIGHDARVNGEVVNGVGTAVHV